MGRLNDDTFKSDLAKGHEHERVVLRYIQKKYPEAVMMEGYTKEYDIWIPEIGEGIEVKSDEKSQLTGNIIIEIEFNGKPSALSTTKALYWVIWDGVEYSWFKPEVIRKFIKDRKLWASKFTARGDKAEKKAYIIKKKTLWKYRELASQVE